MNFFYKDYFNTEPTTGYETLVYDCMIGDAMLFNRADGVEAGWAVVQPILDLWTTTKRSRSKFTPQAAPVRKGPTSCYGAAVANGARSHDPHFSESKPNPPKCPLAMSKEWYPSFPRGKR